MYHSMIVLDHRF